VFAASGALVAARKRLDIVGFMWLAVVTGVGGGTVRDLVLGAPVFWVQHPVHVSSCLATAIVMHFLAPLVEPRAKMLLWFDAFGLALVTVAGTAKALDMGATPLVAIVMGVVTGSVGGIIRDTLGHVPSVILRREIYVTASALGACAFTALTARGSARIVAMSAGFLATFLIRGLAIRYGWSLPVFRDPRERSTEVSDGK
jgi:uncharacterized membrane protein YeiH